MLALPPLSLYVHIPWCIRKCPYCDFNSHAAGTELPESSYVDALITDLRQEHAGAQGRTLRSMFFGGGTPSLFCATSIARVVDAAKELLGFDNDIEITLEANPGAAEQAKFSGYRRAGVNRLSIGVQSFNPQSLETLGRIHDGTEAIKAVQAARKAGFNNVNLDLMHGLPGQTAEMAVADLKQAIALQPTHISWYQLTIEPNTEFYHSRPPLPPDPVLFDIQERGLELLENNGYIQYEVSAFSIAGRQSVHNKNYWTFGDYMGIGAGAHGKITEPDGNRILRNQKIRQPAGYLARQADFTARRSIIAPDAMPMEFFMNALRLKDGVPLDFFASRTGLLPESTFARGWRQLEQQGLVYPLGDSLKTTQKGFAFLNDVLIRLDRCLSPTIR